MKESEVGTGKVFSIERRSKKSTISGVNGTSTEGRSEVGVTKRRKQMKRSHE